MLQLLSLIGDGAAGRVRRRRRARREAEGAARAAADSRDGRSTQRRRARAIRRRLGRRRAGASGYREEPGVSPNSTIETYVALQAVHRQLALGGRAVLPARGQAAAQARHRDRDPVQGGAASRCSRARRRGDREPNVLAIRIQPDEGISLQASARRCPGRRWSIAPVTMEFRYGDVVRRRAARGLRAAAARLHARRRDAVHARRRGRGELGLGVAHPPRAGPRQPPRQESSARRATWPGSGGRRRPIA